MWSCERMVMGGNNHGGMERVGVCVSFVSFWRLTQYRFSPSVYTSFPRTPDCKLSFSKAPFYPFFACNYIFADIEGQFNIHKDVAMIYAEFNV
jgi:hypothetical protein